MNRSDRDWHTAERVEGWQLPPAAPWPLRLPVIRHLRALWLAAQVERHHAVGLGRLGACRTGYDEWVVYAVWRGWC